jgi:hypothetical protein
VTTTPLPPAPLPEILPASPIRYGLIHYQDGDRPNYTLCGLRIRRIRHGVSVTCVVCAEDAYRPGRR